MDRAWRPTRNRKSPAIVVVLPLLVGGLLLVPAAGAGGPHLPAHAVAGLRALANSNQSAPWALGVNGTAVTYDSDNHEFFVSNPANDTVLVVNGSTRQMIGRPISVGSAGPSVFDTDNGYVYVVSAGPGGGGGVTVINGTTDAIVPSRIVVGGDPQAIAFDARDNLLFVANYGTHNLSEVNGIDQRVQDDSIFLGDAQSPTTLAFDQRTGILYVGLWDTVAPGMYSGGSVALVNIANWTLQNVSVGSGLGPTSLAYDPKNQQIYETGYQSTLGLASPIVAINGTTENTSTLPNASLNGGSVVVAGNLGWVYFGSDDGPPRAFDTATDSFASAPLAAPGEPAAFDPASGWLLLLAPGTEPGRPPNAIEAVQDTALVPVSFVETGLPSGTAWNVELANSALGNRSSTSTIGFLAWNGSYSFGVTPVAGETTAYSGTIRVDGPTTSMAVAFVPFRFPVTFLELGLPAGFRWSASVVSGPANGLNDSASTTNLVLGLANGTYQVEFSAPGYTTPSGSYSVVVNGSSPANQTVLFTALPASPALSAGLLELFVAVVVGVLVLGGIVVVLVIRSRRPPPRAPPNP